VIFITQMVDDHSSKGRFCEKCARDKALGEGWLTELIEQWGDESLISDEMREAMQGVPIDEIMLELFETEIPDSWEENAVEVDPAFTSGMGEEMGDGDSDYETDAFDSDSLDSDAFDSDAFDSDHFESSAFEPQAAPLPSPHFSAALRCPDCNTTWDRLKHDGRAGCSMCYSAFRDQLLDVMARVQRGETHVGKAPREAQKRRRRAENLRARREHQLALLHNRLKDAVAAEKYEVAAKLRDKIRDVTDNTNE
jgi:protein arginine kinase activator